MATKITTWADSFGIWYADVRPDELLDEAGLADLAHRAIAEQLAQRMSPHITPVFQVEYVEIPTEGVYRFRETE